MKSEGCDFVQRRRERQGSIANDPLSQTSKKMTDRRIEGYVATKWIDVTRIMMIPVVFLLAQGGVKNSKLDAIPAVIPCPGEGVRPVNTGAPFSPATLPALAPPASRRSPPFA